VVLEHYELVIAFLLAQRHLGNIVIPGRGDVALDSCAFCGAEEDQLAFEREAGDVAIGGNDGVGIDDGTLDGGDVVVGGGLHETFKG